MNGSESEVALKTRLLKTECLDCGYVARVTRTHLAAYGPPLCPCNSDPMFSAEWLDYQHAEAERDAAESGVRLRPIREKWVDTRSIQECSRCREEIQRGEHAHYAAYTVGGDFHAEYTCMRCHPDTASQWGAAARVAL